MYLHSEAEHTLVYDSKGSEKSPHNLQSNAVITQNMILFFQLM
jgi:hypothetical protein